MQAETLRREIVAGVTTFITMAYIVIVNPAILATEGTGMSFSGVMTATVLVCFLSTLLMGLYAKLPYAVAPGMGINAFFTYTMLLGEKIPWQVGLGIVTWSGVIFLLVSLTPLRPAIVRAVPASLRIAAACGIGLFLCFIGLKNGGIVVAHPVTLVSFGGLTPQMGLTVLGLVVATALLMRKWNFAFLAAIVVVTAVAWVGGQVTPPASLTAAPDFSSVFFKVDLWGALRWTFVPVFLTLLFTDLFDSLSTFMGVAQAANLLDEEGQPQRMREGLIVDAFATFMAGLFGTSSGTTYIESAAGVEVGGRTGVTAVVAALCFLPCLFLSPLAAMVPASATASVFILVGALMFRSVRELSLQRLEEFVPAFLTILLIPLTFSITQGIMWGFMSHALLFLLAGRKNELSPVLISLAVLSALLLAVQAAT